MSRQYIECKKLKEILLGFSSRSERYDAKYLMNTFVDVGAVHVRLSSAENQALFGRRGTGKTHVLNYLHDKKLQRNELSVLIDMRLLGSSGSVYADSRQPPGERAVRMFVDFMLSIHESIRSQITKNPDRYDYSTYFPVLDRLADVVTSREIIGSAEYKVSGESASTNTFGLDVGFSDAKVTAKTTISSSDVDKASSELKRVGVERINFNIGVVGGALKDLADILDQKKIWIFIDEWSEIPHDLQPYLADLIKKVFFPVGGLVVKIAAIEHRSKFRVEVRGSGFLGIELGAEMPNSISLDEVLVFDNDPEKAKKFFSALIYKHLEAVYKGEKEEAADKLDNDLDEVFFYETQDELIKALFNRGDTFSEFVRAAEGVPRDAVTILSQLALSYDDNKISIPEIRKAAKICYQRYKHKDVASNHEAVELLSWIVDKVLGKKQARAFLIETTLEDSVLDHLYDARVLHLIKQGVSGQDEAGKRFNAYSIDYGCYVDLINTVKEPKRLFDAELLDESSSAEVPVDDYRSIRRAILDLSDFYNRKQNEQFELFVKGP
ncbi:hypothetical protein [Chromobacterium violaceum]|uniref:hypothetical protein n=1 Tax=Chromobacterium violaceum TaxID=536 RepID=UPI00143D3CD2|nr:hypothetical protein [Chromobacterium violaceum]QIY81182.1 hypothetical protein FOB43_19275 [Chromobacterium violaceum]